MPDSFNIIYAIEMGAGLVSRNKNIFRICARSALLVLFLSGLLAACSKNNEPKTIQSLKVAVLPDQDAAELRRRYRPLLDHIEEHSYLRFQLLIPDSYEQLLQWFDEKKIDMAKFGGVTYVKANLKNKAVPLVMRDVDGRFRSVALVRTKDNIKNLRDTRGLSLAFGSPLSTSGHFMPRYFLEKKNIIPEKFFRKIEHSDAHDKTAEWVRDGLVDVGIANSGIIDEMFKDGRLSSSKVKVIWVSPPFSDYVWAVQPDMKKDIKTAIRNPILHMNQSDEDKELLKNLGANYYIPAGYEDFNKLKMIMAKSSKYEAER